MLFGIERPRFCGQSELWSRKKSTMNGSEEGWPSQGLFAHDTLRMNEYLQLRYVAETGQLFNYEKTTPVMRMIMIIIIMMTYYYFRNVKNAVQSAKQKRCSIYRYGTLAESKCSMGIFWSRRSRTFRHFSRQSCWQNQNVNEKWFRLHGTSQK